MITAREPSQANCLQMRPSIMGHNRKSLCDLFVSVFCSEDDKTERKNGATKSALATLQENGLFIVLSFYKVSAGLSLIITILSSSTLA